MISARVAETIEENLSKLYSNKSLGGSRACSILPGLFKRTKIELTDYFEYKELRTIVKAYKDVAIQPHLSSVENLLYVVRDYCRLKGYDSIPLEEKITELTQGEAIILLEDIYIFYNVPGSYQRMSHFINSYLDKNSY